MIKTLARSAAALLATSALIIGGIGTADARPKPLPKASASIVALPATVRPFVGPYVGTSMDLGMADVQIKYRCVNNATTRYFIYMDVTRVGSKYYSIGARNAPGGQQLAECTGKVVTKTYRVYTSPFGDVDGLPYLQRGTATLSLWLSSRAATQAGYYGEPGTGPSASSTRGVRVVV